MNDKDRLTEFITFSMDDDCLNVAYISRTVTSEDIEDAMQSYADSWGELESLEDMVITVMNSFKDLEWKFVYPYHIEI